VDTKPLTERNLTQVPATTGEQIEADIELISNDAIVLAAAAVAAFNTASGATSQGSLLRRSSSTLSHTSLLSSRRNSGTPGAARPRRNSSVFERGSLGSSCDEPAAANSLSGGKRSLKLIAKMRSVQGRDRPRITITRAPTLDQSGRNFRNYLYSKLVKVPTRIGKIWS
jgi:hypothetical protein